MLIQQGSITFQKIGSRKFWRITNSALKKGKSALPLLFNVPEVLSSASNKAKMLTDNFSTNSKLNGSGISLPAFPSETNLKLNISVTSTLIKKFITNFDSSKASGRDCIPVVVLNNCQFELWLLYLRKLRRGLRLKTTTVLVFFLLLVKSLKTCK